MRRSCCRHGGGRTHTEMAVELTPDPWLKDVDNEIVEIAFEEFKRNIDLVGIHLRDARNLLYGVQETHDDRLLGKAGILPSAAALESNLVYLSGVALRIAEKRAGIFAPPQIRYLKGIGATLPSSMQARYIGSPL
jgi:hypothetical protein